MFLPGAPEPAPGDLQHDFGGAPFSAGPPVGENSAEISLADLAPAMQRAAAHATEVATEPEPKNPYATPPPSSPQPYIPVEPVSEAELSPEPEAEAEPLPSHVPTPGVVLVGESLDDAQDADDADDEEFPEPPALLDPVDGDEPARPVAPSSTPTLYGDDAEPLDRKSVV